jgi:Zn-dependent protease with chaperone function
MKHTLRAVLALGLLAGFHLLSLAVLAALAFLCYAFVALDTPVWLLVVPLLICFCAGYLVLVVQVASRRPGREAPAGILLTTEDQPELWSRVRAIAEEVGSPPPDEIRLVAEADACLSESARLLGLAPGVRRLTLGVPLLLGLTRGRLAALLAHELGHHRGPQRGVAVTTYRGGEAVRAVLRELGDESRVGRVFAGYAHLYLRLADETIGTQELEADEAAARIAGRNVTLAALRELAPLDVAWRTYRTEYVDPAHLVGLRPRGIAEGFLDFLEDPGRKAQLAAIREGTAESPRTVSDGHPPMARRVAMLRALIEHGPEDDVLPGFAVLTDPDATMAAFFATGYRDQGDLEPADWEQIGSTVSRHEAESRASALVQALRTAPWRRGQAVTFEAVATELRAGRGAALAARAFDDVGGSAEQRQLAGVLVGALLAATLVTREVAAYHLDWAGSGRLVDRSGRPVDVTGLGNRAVGSEQGLLELLAFAEEHGIGPTDVLDVARSGDDEPEPARVLACLAPVQLGSRWVMLMPCSSGLAVVRPRGARELTTIGAVVVAVETARRLASVVLEAPLEEALQRPGSVLFAWDEIVSARLTERLLRKPLLTVTTRSGDTCRLRMLRLTDSFGDPWDPWDVMHHFLGERFVVHTPAAERRTGSRAGVLEP